MKKKNSTVTEALPAIKISFTVCKLSLSSKAYAKDPGDHSR